MSNLVLFVCSLMPKCLITSKTLVIILMVDACYSCLIGGICIAAFMSVVA